MQNRNGSSKFIWLIFKNIACYSRNFSQIQGLYISNTDWSPVSDLMPRFEMKIQMKLPFT